MNPAVKRPRVSASFSEAQVTLMHEILSQLARGGDPKLLTRNKSFGPLYAVVASMRKRSQEPPPVRLIPAPLPPAEPADTAEAADPSALSGHAADAAI
jgi:hypothetical protein